MSRPNDPYVEEFGGDGCAQKVNEFKDETEDVELVEDKDGMCFCTHDKLTFLMLPLRNENGAINVPENIRSIKQSVINLKNSTQTIKKQGKDTHCETIETKLMKTYSFRDLVDMVNGNNFGKVCDIDKDLPNLYDVSPLLLDEKTAVDFLVWKNVIKPDQRCPKCGGKR